MLVLAIRTHPTIRRSLLAIVKTVADLGGSPCCAAQLAGVDDDVSGLAVALVMVIAVWLPLQLVFFRGQMRSLFRLVRPMLPGGARRRRWRRPSTYRPCAPASGSRRRSSRWSGRIRDRGSWSSTTARGPRRARWFAVAFPGRSRSPSGSTSASAPPSTGPCAKCRATRSSSSTTTSRWSPASSPA